MSTRDDTDYGGMVALLTLAAAAVYVVARNVLQRRAREGLPSPSLLELASGLSSMLQVRGLTRSTQSRMMPVRQDDDMRFGDDDDDDDDDGGGGGGVLADEDDLEEEVARPARRDPQRTARGPSAQPLKSAKASRSKSSQKVSPKTKGKAQKPWSAK